MIIKVALCLKLGTHSSCLQSPFLFAAHQLFVTHGVIYVKCIHLYDFVLAG